MNVIFKPQMGYTKGVLSGNRCGNQNEIILPNGATILLYEHEYTKEKAPIPYKKMTFPLCGNKTM